MPRYELSDGTSNKFWEIELSGKRFTCRFGKIGANGQTQIKDHATPAAALAAYEKLIAEKTKKGYALAGGGKKSAARPTAAKTATKGKPPAASSSGQYFEFKGGGSNKFWEITLADKAFTTRFGKIGTDGQTSAKSYKNAGEARAEYDKLVAEKTKKGYKLVRGDAPVAAAPVHARDAKLEAALVADPDNADAYLVYADWLQAQGDPRGELIVLQHAKKTKQATKLLADNAEHFFGPVAKLQNLLAPSQHHRKVLGKPTTWRWGYLESLWIGNKHEHDPEFGGKDVQKVDIDELLGALLDHPSARVLRELTVGINTMMDNGYTETAKVIGKRNLPTLRRLVIGDFYYEETELNWSNAGNMEPLYKAVPNLESLTIRSGSMRLGKLALPKLKELTLIGGGLDKGSVAGICGAKWPVLETLSIQIGDEGDVQLKHLMPILEGTAFPKLKHLGLRSTSFSDELCTLLASSKIAPRLETLDLSMGQLGDAGALALAEGKFPKLTSIDVSKNYLTDAGVKALKKLTKNVDDDEQEDDDGDPDNRYVSGRE
jgi:uncharacterized protein (TIGR02996 family)